MLKPTNATQTEVWIEGYTLILRAPTLHQHEAIMQAFSAIDLAPVLAILKPVTAAVGGAPGEIVARLTEAAPAALSAFKAQILTNGFRAIVQAAAICLDTRVNHRRLSKPCPDDDYAGDRALPEDDEPQMGPDGAVYLQSDALRAWVAGSITTDAAFGVIVEAVRLSGLVDMGKALWAGVLGTIQGTVQATAAARGPATTEPVTA